jgi:hypothetical protein
VSRTKDGEYMKGRMDQTSNRRMTRHDGPGYRNEPQKMMRSRATENKVECVTPLKARRNKTPDHSRGSFAPIPSQPRGNLSVRPVLPFPCYDFLGALGPARNTSIDIS